MTATNKSVRILIICLAAVGAFMGWRFLGSNTNFKAAKQFLYIKDGSSFAQVMAQMEEKKLLKNLATFSWVAQRLNYDKNIIAGKYQIDRGASIFTLLKTLKSGRQTPVNLVITKLRTKEDLAQKIGANFQCDSAAFMALLNDNEQLSQFGLDTNTAMTAIVPNTYLLFWTSAADKVFKKLFTAQQVFWNVERKQKAAALQLSPQQVYTLASIVEEETTQDADKGKAASVYLNRLSTGMRLSADPTVIFALKDFTIRRVYKKYTQVAHPYNTYLNSGLPPGPICTPSIKTIDAVLNAPKTDYLYFVAQPNLTGYSNFATNYEQHQAFARQYQDWLNEYLKKKAAATK